jgi:LacI family transcriptional regulator
MALQRSRVTSRDVAREAGVSLNTVSLVVRDSPLVAPATKERVRAVIHALNYRPHAAAAALRSTRSHTLGFLVPWRQEAQPDAPALSAELYPAIDVFRNQLLNAMTEQARTAGYHLLLDTFVDIQRCLGLVDSARIDGALIDMLVSDDLVDALIARSVPLVLAGRDAGNRPISWIKADEEGGAYAAARHLLDLGHRRFGVISASNEERHPVVRERIQGFRRALAEAGLVVGVAAHGDWSFGSGYRLGQEILQSPDPPTALFVLSEVMAAGTLQGTLALGLRVPDDLAIVTTEDSPLVEYLQPQLSAVHVPMYDVGRRAAQTLLALLEDPHGPPQQIVLPTTFVARQSSLRTPRTATEDVAVHAADPARLPGAPDAPSPLAEGGANQHDA